MGGSDIAVIALGSVNVSPEQARAAAVHIADRIAAEHPHPLDDLMPRLAGRQDAADPDVRRELTGLLAVLGLAHARREAT